MNFVHKFNQESTAKLEDLKNSKVYIAREKLNNGEKLTREEKNFITEKCITNSFYDTCIPLSGYCFDFSDILNKYLIKFPFTGVYYPYYAADKTSLRKYFKDYCYPRERPEEIIALNNN